MKLIKYPRTRHAPWSRTVGDDDKMHASMQTFLGREVVVTEKMDGECTTLYREHMHARSLDSRHHPSRDAVKGIWGSVRHLIPDGWRICGENMYAEHSIAYDHLPSYFLAFSVWNECNQKLSYDDGKSFVQSLGLFHVRELWRGIYDEKTIQGLLKEQDFEHTEGYVIQVTDSFHYDDFGKYVAKFVRPKHVQTDEHWMHKSITPNKIKM